MSLQAAGGPFRIPGESRPAREVTPRSCTGEAGFAVGFAVVAWCSDAKPEFTQIPVLGAQEAPAFPEATLSMVLPNSGRLAWSATEAILGGIWPADEIFRAGFSCFQFTAPIVAGSSSGRPRRPPIVDVATGDFTKIHSVWVGKSGITSLLPGFVARTGVIDTGESTGASKR